MKKKVVVIGGGAAGFFAAINCAKAHPDYEVTILEKAAGLLYKVSISGGGRCNVTHACFEPKDLVKFYPRGEKQLLGPFTRFNPTHTIDWFEQRGVNLKTEEDGRMFPVTDSSQTIIDCFMQQAFTLGVKIKTHVGVEHLIPPNETEAHWTIITQKGESIFADSVIVTTGSGSRMWGILAKLGHTLIPPVPSLFTVNINDTRIKGLEGLSVLQATVKVHDTNLSATGPLLITHWGMSGPAILRLSAWGARMLNEKQYKFTLQVNWLNQEKSVVEKSLRQFKESHPKKNVIGNPLFNLPRRLWEKLITPIVPAGLNYADLSNKQIEDILEALSASQFAVTGKSTFKDEFVTAGGIDLNEVDFKTMQSKNFKGLFFAGEVLDIDAITGGFNFQAAWTTGWTAGISS